MASPIFLRDKMKEIDLRLVDLAQFLELSRPTIYKLIEYYECGQRSEIDSKILKLFDFISQSSNKASVMSYIVDHHIKLKEQLPQDRTKQIATLLDKENKMKVKFIDKISQSQIFDPILEYLLQCEAIMSQRKKVLSEQEIEILEPLNTFYQTLGFRLPIKNNKEKR